ncbi:XRE family transcriptional regulator, partial [Pseudomonas aeruginosa]|nr:XRE family transcriptional regulator [Pseudomonas aeruginosa]
SIAHERSVILEKIFAALRADGVGKAGVAGELAISPEEINELTFGLMLNVLKAQSANPSDSGGKSGAHLRLVKG